MFSCSSLITLSLISSLLKTSHISLCFFFLLLFLTGLFSEQKIALQLCQTEKHQTLFMLSFIHTTILFLFVHWAGDLQYHVCPSWIPFHTHRDVKHFCLDHNYTSLIFNEICISIGQGVITWPFTCVLCQGWICGCNVCVH